MRDNASYDELSVAELTDSYRRGLLSPVDVVEDSLCRAEASSKLFNAFVTICGEQALTQATAVAAAFRDGRPLGPLAGVPITVKDILPTENVRTTYGSPTLANNIPMTDAVSVGRLVAAGAIVIGKTATPEFACRQTTSSPVSGICRNPLDPALTPGGSSGGSAAATVVGAGCVSLVTDGGGSARLPAACVGIVGMKPTFGRIPFDSALDAFGGLGHIGLMARSIADLQVALSVASGPASSDPFSLAAPPPLDPHFDEPKTLEGLRVGFQMRLAGEPVEAEYVPAIEASLARLLALGARVDPLEGEIEPPLPIWRALQASIWAERYGARPEIMKRIDPVIAEGIEFASALSAQQLQAALHGRTRLFRNSQSWFDTFDIIVTPTLARGPLAADHPGSGPITIDGRDAGDIREAWAPFLGLFTMTGHPAISLNCGWTSAGLPIGLQLVGRWHADDALLRIASLLESAMPEAAWRRPPFQTTAAESRSNEEISRWATHLCCGRRARKLR